VLPSPSLGYPDKESKEFSSSKAGSRPLSRIYILGDFTWRFLRFSCQGGFAALTRAYQRNSRMHTKCGLDPIGGSTAFNEHVLMFSLKIRNSVKHFQGMSWQC